MNRLDFLRTLFLGAAACGTQALARPHPEAKGAWVLNRCPVAGFFYHDGPSVLPRLRVGDPIAIRAEFENPHDRHAIALWHGDAKLGYVPRNENRHLARLLRQGAPLQARILALAAASDQWPPVRVEISLADPMPS